MRLWDGILCSIVLLSNPQRSSFDVPMSDRNLSRRSSQNLSRKFQKTIQNYSEMSVDHLLLEILKEHIRNEFSRDFGGVSSEQKDNFKPQILKNRRKTPNEKENARIRRQINIATAKAAEIITSISFSTATITMNTTTTTMSTTTMNTTTTTMSTTTPVMNTTGKG